jgi:hypothetical protein
MTQATYTLKYGLFAIVLAGDDDRLPYVAPPAPPKEPVPHPAYCPCPKCSDARRARGELP